MQKIALLATNTDRRLKDQSYSEQQFVIYMLQNMQDTGIKE